MKKIAVVLIVVLELMAQTISEFPIETSGDSTFATAFSQDNEKFLIIMRKEISTGGAEIRGQFISKTDNSVIDTSYMFGTTPISMEDKIDLAFPQVSFDGSRFLVTWTDTISGSYIIKGRFINAQTFQMSNEFDVDTFTLLSGFSTLHFNPVTNLYLLISYDTLNGIFGTFIDTNGNITAQIQITSQNPHSTYTLAYGNSEYLTCWVNNTNDYEIWGQIINENGTLTGSNFLIDGSVQLSDNPIFALFDGTKFTILFTDEETDGWKIYARFVNPDGTVQSVRPLITSSGHMTPYASSADSNLFITWTSLDSLKVFGRLFDLSANPLGEEFKVFDTLGTKIPLSNSTVFLNNKFYVFTNRVNIGFNPDSSPYFLDGDIYGAEITGLSVKELSKGWKYNQLRIMPLFSNRKISVSFSISTYSSVLLKIYDISGREKLTLISEKFYPGKYRKEFDIKKLYSGLYIVNLRINSVSKVEKFILIK